MSSESTLIVANSQPPKTREQVKQEFWLAGRSITDWSQAHGIERHVVYGLLDGKTKGCRGEAHRAAVLLGLKPDLSKATVRTA